MSTETPPGPDGLPIVGNAIEYARDPLTAAERWAAAYGPVAKFAMPGMDGYYVTEPALVERVLVGNAGAYRKPAFSRRQLGSLVGESVLLTEGEQWRRQRRLLQPAFYPDRVREYAPTMLAATERAVAEWADGDVVDVHAAMTELTLSVLCGALFDVDPGDRVGEVREAVTAIVERFRPNPRVPIVLPEWVPTPANRRYRRGLETLEDVIASLAEKGETDGGGLLATLQAALAEGNLSEREFRDQLLAMLLAGHETTATALTAAWYLLATHPDAQERLATEAAGIGGPPSPDECEFAAAVVKEAVRLYPPIPSLFREATEPDELGGYPIQTGAIVAASPWALHRDERFFDDPEAFRPERWLDDCEDGTAAGESDREDEIPDCAYIPFGAGPRNCIGRRFATQEATLVLATLARRFRFEPTAESSFDPVATVTLRPDGPVRLRVRER